jgi:hypothetical protein
MRGGVRFTTTSNAAVFTNPLARAEPTSSISVLGRHYNQNCAEYSAAVLFRPVLALIDPRAPCQRLLSLAYTAGNLAFALNGKSTL